MVGDRTCTMTVPRLQPGRPVHLAIEWSPTMPRRLSDAELDEYRVGRDAALADVARELGVTAALLEV
jgi:hypothetical protein